MFFLQPVDNDSSYNSAAYHHFHGVTEEQAASQESAGPPEDWGFTNALAPAGEHFFTVVLLFRSLGWLLDIVNIRYSYDTRSFLFLFLLLRHILTFLNCPLKYHFLNSTRTGQARSGVGILRR